MAELTSGAPNGGTMTEQEIDIRRLGYVLRRNAGIVLGLAAGVIAAAVLFLLLQRPVYQAEATLQINQERPGVDLLGGMLPAGLGVVAGLEGRDDIQTDIAVLESRQVTEGVVDSLGLQLALLDRDRHREAVLRVLNAPRGELQGVYRLRLREDGTYSLEVEQGDRPSGLPARVEIGQPFQVGEYVLALQPSLRAAPPERIRFEIQPFRAAVAQVRKKVRVSRAASRAQIVEIRFRHEDPVLAAAVPNVITQSFIRYKNRVSNAESRNSVEFLEGQSAAYAADLRAAEARLQNFRERAQIVEPRTQATEQVRQLAELQARRGALQAERESLRRVLTRIDSRSAGVGEPSPYRRLAAFPTFIANGTVQNILQSLIQQEDQRAKLLVQRTEQNVDVQGVNQRIEELELQLYQLSRNYLDGIDTQIASLDAQLARFGSQLDLVPAREVEFLRLTRDQRLLEEVYRLIQTRLKEAQIEAASEAANVQLLDAALVPEQPAFPPPVLILVLAVGLGIAAGVSGAFVREYLNPRVLTRQDVVGATDGLPVVGAIPRMRGGAIRGRHQGRWARLPHNSTAAPERLVALGDPRSPAAEAYRTLRTNLARLPTDGPSRVLIVTSASAEDGKSTSASNLAVALAQQGTPTLLVDADLRAGHMHEAFGVAREPGFADVLFGRVSLDDAVRAVDAGDVGTPLHLLPTGTIPSNPAELLDSDRMRALLDELRARYRVIIMDTPPLNLVADAAVLATITDAALLVARMGSTPKMALQEAAERLRALHVPASGVVVNDSPSIPAYNGDGSA
jgi:tyrosine-protein kinase Etk/Wzc